MITIIFWFGFISLNPEPIDMLFFPEPDKNDTGTYLFGTLLYFVFLNKHRYHQSIPSIGSNEMIHNVYNYFLLDAYINFMGIT